MKRCTILAALATVGVLLVIVALGGGRQGGVLAAVLNTGYLNPSSNAPDAGGMYGGDGFEYYPEYAYSDGAGAARSFQTYGERHRYGAYNISVPAGATITGIEVRADWWLNGEGTYDHEQQLHVDLSWDGGTHWSSGQTDRDYSMWSQETVVLGSPTYTWERAWTAGELSNGNFLVRVEWFTYDSSAIYLDWLPVKVYYEEAATPTPTDTPVPPTPTPTDTPVPPTPTPTDTPVPPTPTPTDTPVPPTPTPTDTPVPSTPTPTDTPVPPTPTPTDTVPPTPTPTDTPVPPTPTHTPTPYVPGDGNGDGQASMVDAMLTAQYVAGLIGGDTLNLAAADVNCSGTATMLDAMLVAQKVAGLISDFVACVP